MERTHRIFEGKNVVVTGAGRGIGREIALAFARQGAKVLVNDLGSETDGTGQDQAVANEVVSEIQGMGETAIAHTGSIAEFDTAADIIHTCVKTLGKIDVLVNAAGIGRGRPIWEASEEDFDILTAVHLKGTFNLCHHACRYMKQQRYGRIINFTSDFWRGLAGFYFTSIYSAVKAGIVGLTRGIAHEMEAYDVTCNAVAPLASTRMLISSIPISVKDAYEAGKLEQWFYDELIAPGDPKHIPPVVLFLASEKAAGITGKVVGASKGRVALYAEPDEKRRLQKTGLWTVEELLDILPGFFI
ncbi:SDR family NAD(P)-dependent oxidoreductase [Chloroflexota bacterium]